MKAWPHTALFAYLVVLAVSVLTPLPPPMPPDPSAIARSADGLLADAVRNLLLLLPLGWLVSAGGRGPFAATAIGLALSVAVEGMQSLIPGRDTSLVDILTNTTSAAAGALLYTTRRRWLAPAPAASARFALVWFVTPA